jgi:hypothetical protein
MTVVDNVGYVSITLSAGGDSTVNVRLSNVKPTALDADVYAVVNAIAGLLNYPVDSILRTSRKTYSA